MILQISIKDEKAKFFLELIEELKESMVDKYQIISDEVFDEQELINRSNEIKNKKVEPISRKEVFDGLC